VVSESFPHLRRGALRDFLLIMKEHNYFEDYRWNKTESTYTFPNGSTMEFFSADDSKKMRGGRRDRLFINEVNNIAFSSFEELEVRTKELVIIDWNPTNEFWFYTDVMGVRDDVEHLILTYKDNEALSKEIVDSIEQRKNRKDWWRVYGLGLLGELEGKIYTKWEIIDEIPDRARLERRGLDFGYTNDPSTLVGIYKWNDAFVLDEEFYLKGLSNRQIATKILAQPEQVLVFADSVEPKSIDEIAGYGIGIVGAVKGPGSVNYGIQFVQDQKIYVTKRSINIIKEYRNYLWKVDKNGKVINEPEHAFSHSMDAIRYGLSDYFPKTSVGDVGKSDTIAGNITERKF